MRLSKGYSERELCKLAGLSRLTLRAIELLRPTVTIQSLLKYATALGLELGLYTAQSDSDSNFSTVAICLRTTQEGFNTWKIHFMDFVDEFRRTLDTRLLLLPPPAQTDAKLKALLASIVLELCDEAKMAAPSWAKKSYALPEPWFLSEMESLKASALVESPVFYKMNNIFVLDNFLKRA
jgi:transcriptional regulator with XRE-family HTH domain